MSGTRFSDGAWARLSSALASERTDEFQRAKVATLATEGRRSRVAALAFLATGIVGGLTSERAPLPSDAAFLPGQIASGSSMAMRGRPLEDPPVKSAAVLALSCASIVSAQSNIMGWGRNEYGQASPPPGLQHTIALSAGLYHSLALRPEGSVVAWGWNSSGQCDVPEDLENSIEVHAAYQHSAVLERGGRVRCFGSNSHGQCSVPSGMLSARSIGVGDDFTIAVLVDGTVRCWGLNTNQQCEVPKSTSGIVRATGGAAFVLAQRASGDVVAWGRNDFGQCDIPQDLGATVQVVGGAWHGIALRADGAVRTWGRNEYGQLNVPTDLGPVVAISGDRSNVTMVLQADGTVRAWGQWNREWNNPTPPASGAPWRAIACGGYHAIGLPSRAPCAGDLDGNGATDASDLTEVLGGWGNCP